MIMLSFVVILAAIGLEHAAAMHFYNYFPQHCSPMNSPRSTHKPYSPPTQKNVDFEFNSEPMQNFHLYNVVILSHMAITLIQSFVLCHVSWSHFQKPWEQSSLSTALARCDRLPSCVYWWSSGLVVPDYHLFPSGRHSLRENIKCNMDSKVKY